MATETLFNVPVQELASDERFTPKWIFTALGITFDLDPASPVGMDTFVPARKRFTREDDGLSQEWEGRVWLNPPFSNATPWANKFIEHGYGIWLGPVANSDWFQRMARVADRIWLMRDFPFVHPTHAGKRSSMPLALMSIGCSVPVELAARNHPDAGVLVGRLT